jgi:hypothetical protein
MADPDWNDPCAVAAWLKPQLHMVAAGQAVAEVKYGEQDVKYSQANYSALLTLYTDAVSQCAKKNGVPSGRRRAFVGG